MPYFKNQMVMRNPRGGMAGWTDTVGDLLKGAVSFYGQQQQAQGAAQALAQQGGGTTIVQSSGPSTTTLVIGGVAVAGVAYLLLRKRK